jgi:hypothetical protein
MWLRVSFVVLTNIKKVFSWYKTCLLDNPCLRQEVVFVAIQADNLPLTFALISCLKRLKTFINYFIMSYEPLDVWLVVILCTACSKHYAYPYLHGLIKTRRLSQLTLLNVLSVEDNVLSVWDCGNLMQIIALSPPCLFDENQKTKIIRFIQSGLNWSGQCYVFL